MAGSSVGTIVKYGATTVTEVVSLTLPDITHEDVDLTELTDTAKNYRPGLIDPGTIPMTLRWDANATGAGTTIFGKLGGAVETWTIAFYDAGTLTFEGFVSEVGGEIPEGGGSITQTVTIQLTDSEPTYAVVA